VVLTTPSTDTTVTSPILVTAEATDDGEVAGVQFLLNGVSLGEEDLTAPYASILNTDTLPDGVFELAASARDTAGNTASSAVILVTLFHPDTTPPTVIITAPENGAAIIGDTLVTADATDDRQLAGVLFLFDGVGLAAEDLEAPFEVMLVPDTLAAGQFDLTAIARDTAGNLTTSAPVAVTINHPDLTPPTVTITAPQDGSSVTGVITITATATDNTAIDGVQFQLNGGNLGPVDALAPYTVVLNTYTLPDGLVTLLAIARDIAGNTTSSSPATVTVSNPTPLNVVVIISDDQRFDHMQHMPLTSALLNPQSVVFTKGFVTTPLCCPARTSIFTGLYAHNTGVLTNTAPNGGAGAFSPVSTMATWLHSQGWRTGLIGKYLNEYFRISPAIPPGWDDFQAIVDNAGTFGYYNYQLNENGTLRTYGSGAQNYTTSVLVQKAQSFIQNTPARQPLMLFFTPPNPHAPSNPHPSDIGRYASQPNWRPPSYNEAVVTDKPTFVKNLPRFTTGQINSSDALHRSMLESLQSLDRAVVDLVGTLQQTNRWDNTLLIFLSDNGLSWGEHRLLDRKQCPYDECIRVPFIVRAPGITAREDTNLVANIDITPTITGFAGVTPPYPLKGKNLLDLIRTPATPWRTELLFEQLGNPNAKSFQGIRTHRYMYNEYLNGEKELYDLKTDPYQNTNVVTKPGNANLVNGLKAKLNALKNS
jgi:N-acetylglucosamine-6-sulfatase